MASNVFTQQSTLEEVNSFDPVPPGPGDPRPLGRPLPVSLHAPGVASGPPASFRSSSRGCKVQTPWWPCSLLQRLWSVLAVMNGSLGPLSSFLFHEVTLNTCQTLSDPSLGKMIPHWGIPQGWILEELNLGESLPGIGEGNGSPLQCSCLENPTDRGAR